jgi:hypothetical protein
VRSIHARTIAVVSAAVATLVVSVPALARMCHPDPPGTRTLVVHGDVAGYTFVGGRVRLVLSSPTGCRTFAWNVLAAPTRRTVFAGGSACSDGLGAGLGAGVSVPDLAPSILSASDGTRTALVSPGTVRLYDRVGLLREVKRARQVPAQKVVLRGRTLVVLVRGSDVLDRPDRLEVYDMHRGRFVRSWALPDQATTLDLAEGIVVFSAAHGGAYAVRLRDGVTTLISPNRHDDLPQIERVGVVYEDGTFVRDRRAHRVPVKFIPMTAVATDFARTYHTFTTPGPITGLAMDGPNVAVTFRGAEQMCDQVLIWDALWHDVAQPTMEGGLSCPKGHRPGRIRSVTVGNIAARWIVASGHVSRVIAASSLNCVQHLVATADSRRGDRIRSVAGDRRWFAFVTTHGDGTATLSVADANDDASETDTALSFRPAALSIDDGTVALLTPTSRVDVLSQAGETLDSITTIGLRSIALRGQTLVGLTRNGTLAVYDMSTGALRHEWRLPHGTRGPVDYHFGIAVVTAGPSVYAVRIADGRIARIADGRSRVAARIDGAGVAYVSNDRGRGYAGFIAMSTVERALGGR